MKSRLAVTAALALCLAAAAFLLLRHHHREVSMILVNGDVYTVNPTQPKAEAVAIDRGVIVGVGTSRDLLEGFKGDTVIDLGGKPVYPGFIDSHAHLEGLGIMLMTLDLHQASSPEEVASLVAAEASRRPAESWIRGRGWDQNLWPGKHFPNRSTLDEAAPGNPVVLGRVDGHAVWANSRALRLAGISRSTADPQGGRVVRDASGEPTGVLIDNATLLLAAVVPPPTREERTEAVRRAVGRCLRFGLTEVHDMGVDGDLVEIYRGLIRDGAFPFRVYAAVEGGSSKRFLAEGTGKGDATGKLTVRAVKLYMDGALGSRGAALFQAYDDDPGNRGHTMMSSDSLRRMAELCLDRGFQLCVHAIGDRANNLVLSAFDEAFKSRKINGTDVRFRVEHAQVLEPADVPRFHRLGVLPMMQPTHCTSDMPWVTDRLGEARARNAYVWRSLLDDGNIVPAGSDFPVESPSPLLGMYAAITRQNLEGKPDSGWHGEQRMTREEALKAYTIWGAYAAFQEERKGTIEIGKWADLVVLSEDIMTVEPRRIPAVRVEKTIVGGFMAYEAPLPSREAGR
jgi:predicted amidohydrolase YtcJ